MNEREQLAKDNGMTIEFVSWFFDNKKDGCGNAWFIMMAAMWEGWRGQEAKCAALREAAQEEIMLRSVSDTSDSWQDLASPEAVLALLDEMEACLNKVRQLNAELEAREVVLPNVQDVHPLGPQSAKMFCEFHRNIVNRCADEIRNAGVKVSIKGR